MNSRQRKNLAPKPNKSNEFVGKPGPFAKKLLREWKRLRLPTSGETIVVGVSGGGDSAALLAGLNELSRGGKLAVRIVVAHLNHMLRGKSSDEDARWVTMLAHNFGYQSEVKKINVLRRARKTSDNLEQAARRARYEFLEKTAGAAKARTVLVAHTLDDQAETFLLNLLRGSGTAGLSGIDAARPIRHGSEVQLVRPLMSWARRCDTESYCRERAIPFRFDSMNEDETFARVRIRKQLLPLLQTFNPRVVDSIARTTEILREDNAALETAAKRLIELSSADAGQNRALRPDLLRFAPPALRHRALRQWISMCQGDLRRLERAHVLGLETFLFNRKSGRVIELPGGAKIIRRSGLFIYDKPR